MRPEIKAAILALHELENVTIEEFGLLRVEMDTIEEKIKKNECKKIFEEKVCKSDNRLLKEFLKIKNLDSISFDIIKDDGEFLTCIVLHSGSKSFAFHINCSDCPEFLTTHYDVEIISYSRDAQNVRDNIDFDISDFADDEIISFLNTVETFSADADTFGLYNEYE